MSETIKIKAKVYLRQEVMNIGEVAQELKESKPRVYEMIRFGTLSMLGTGADNFLYCSRSAVLKFKEDLAKSRVQQEEKRLNQPIKGNDRLEELRQLIVANQATEGEKREFRIGLALYDAESMGDKPWREGKEGLYEEQDQLRVANQAARTV